MTTLDRLQEGLRRTRKARDHDVSSAAIDPPSDVANRDWDSLLRAVKTRLRVNVAERLAATSERQVHDTTDRVQASVIECVAVLDQLQTTLAHELGRRRQLEHEAVDAQAALAQARAELVGTQAGEKHARHLALHDGLTSLPNRSYFLERLDHSLAGLEPQRPALAVLYIDLDGFKQVNDAHGHQAGDELLKIVAARLARAVRAEDTMSRLGGDEFACLVPAFLNRDQLSHMARKLFNVVCAPLTIGELKLTVRPSIGIAMCPADGATAAALLQSADAAMYRAKRNQSRYSFVTDPQTRKAGVTVLQGNRTAKA